MALILNQSQAEAVYSAMCAMNEVGGKIDRIDLEGSEVRVRENTAGRVFVESMERGEEAYFDQSDFATAYGLDHGGL